MEFNTQAVSGERTTSLEETLANLLRSDRVASIRVPDLDEETVNQLWWFLIGRVELARGVAPTVQELARCFEDMPGWPAFEGLTMNRAMYFLWHAKPELQEKFSLEDPSGFWDYLAWFYTEGLRQHLLADFVPPNVRYCLNQRATTAIWPHATSPEEMPPLLLVFVMRTRSELLDTFNLGNQISRLSMLTWFFTMGARRLGLHPLVSDQWRMWCLTPVLTGAGAFECPRIAQLNWVLNPGLQSQFRLDSEESHHLFLGWTDEKFRTDPEWQWLKVPARDKKLSALFSTQLIYPPPTETYGVNLIGFAFGELGIGEDIRMAAAVCEAHQIPYSIVNINPGAVVRQGDLMLEEKVRNQGDPSLAAPYPVNIFCLTGFETARIYLQLGPTLFSHRYNIGWWPWELPKWPKRWKPAFELVDEVWGATQFNIDMYRQATRKPVRLVPLSVKVDRVRNRSRADLGLPEVGFLFLYIFDFNSYIARKNPYAAIEAFQKAFNPHDDSVRLVLKTMHAREKDPAWQKFIQVVEADPRIVIFNRTLDREDVLALVKNCDAYLSLHRSEGFGRTLAEAMLFGKPVVASNYSGNADFLFEGRTFPVEGTTVQVAPREYPFVAQDDKAVWFDADTDHAAAQMRQVRKLHWNRQDRDALVKTAASRFAPENSLMPQTLRSVFLRLQ